jgi:hypothetical protein
MYMTYLHLYCLSTGGAQGQPDLKHRRDATTWKTWETFFSYQFKSLATQPWLGLSWQELYPRTQWCGVFCTCSPIYHSLAAASPSSLFCTIVHGRGRRVGIRCIAFGVAGRAGMSASWSWNRDTRPLGSGQLGQIASWWCLPDWASSTHWLSYEPLEPATLVLSSVIDQPPGANLWVLLGFSSAVSHSVSFHRTCTRQWSRPNVCCCYSSEAHWHHQFIPYAKGYKCLLPLNLCWF